MYPLLRSAAMLTIQRTDHQSSIRVCPLTQVAFSEERSSFLSFLTSVCAIVGGVFTVSGILDSFVFHGAQVIRKKKVDLGKFS